MIGKFEYLDFYDKVLKIFEYIRWDELAFTIYFDTKEDARVYLGISYTQGIKENMYWLLIDKLGDYRAYPMFFRDKLNNIKSEIEHIVTYDN